MVPSDRVQKARAGSFALDVTSTIFPLVFSLDFLPPPLLFFPIFPRLSHANVLRLDPPDRLADTIMNALRIHRLNQKERRQQNNKTKTKLMKAENNKEEPVR